jgi:hypothetical protein
MATCHGAAECCRANLIARVHVGAVAEKYLHNFEVAFACGEHQSRVTENILSVYACSRSNQIHHFNRISARCRFHQFGDLIIDRSFHFERHSN